MFCIYRRNHLPVQLREKLKLCFQEMMENLPIDWHIGSNNQVRDLIHPSLYPYVKGVSALKNGTIEEVCGKRFIVINGYHQIFGWE